MISDRPEIRTNWQVSGACASTGEHDLWFPKRGDPALLAKLICSTCPVLAECRQFGIDHDEITDGVFGGLSPRERRDARFGRLAVSA